jgi:uncharacterized membrane protein
MASRNPATEHLLDSAQEYLGARSERLVSSIGDKVGDTTKRLADVASGKAEPSSLIGGATKRLAKGESPEKAALGGALDSVKEKVKGVFGKGKGPRGRKSMNIEEAIDVGVPLREAYNRWTQFGEFSKWSKAVQTVSQDDPTKSSWNAKIFLSKRNWNAKVTEQIPDDKIAWTSDGPKGTVDGVVTFHELAPNLTRVLLALEYHPAGLFEKTGNIWRAVGRRARLDLKLYRRFAMMTDEDVEGWRGEIRESEVVRDHDEVVAEEQEADEADSEDYEDDSEDDESEEDSYDDESEEDSYDDESEEDSYDDEGEESEEPEQEQRAPRRRAS